MAHHPQRKERLFVRFRSIRRLVGTLLAMCAATAVTALPASASDTVYGLMAGSATSSIVVLDGATGAAVAPPLAVSGVQDNERLVALATRPATGELYGLVVGFSGQPRLVTIELIGPNPGRARPVGALALLNPSSSQRGMAFDPATDELRISDATRASQRFDPATAALIDTDAVPAYATTDVNTGMNPTVRAIAYDTSDSGPAAPTLYGIDQGFSSNRLVRIGSPGGTPVSPATGQLFSVAPLPLLTTISGVSLAISALTGSAYTVEAVTYGSSIATQAARLNLVTGGIAGLGSTLTVGMGWPADLAVAPRASRFRLAAHTVLPQRPGTALVTVIRSDVSDDIATVDYTTGDGSATAGIDYTATSGTLTFAPGETSKTIAVPVTGAADGASFAVALSRPVGGITGGALIERGLGVVTVRLPQEVPAPVPPLPASPLPAPTVVPAPAPALGAVTLANRTFSPVGSKTRTKHGTTLRFTLSRAATVKAALTLLAPGRTVGKACRPDSAKLRKAKAKLCTRSVKAGTLTFAGKAGRNSIAFDGKVSGRRLAAGQYVAAFSASASGKASATRVARFAVVR